MAVSIFLSFLAAKHVDFYLNERIAVLGDFAGFQRSYNAGIAFGINFPPVFQEMLIGVALLLVLWYAIRSVSALSQIALGLILGGGLANIIDRLQDRMVTDFFQVGSFPIFNVADSCITIGVVILLIETFLEYKKQKE